MSATTLLRVVVCFAVLFELSTAVMAGAEGVCGKRVDYAGQSSVDTSNRSSLCEPFDANKTATSFQLSKYVYISGRAQSREGSSEPYNAVCTTEDIYVVASGECAYKGPDGNPILANPVCDPDITDQGSVPGSNPSWSTFPVYRVRKLGKKQFHPPNTDVGYMECQTTTDNTVSGTITGACPPNGCLPKPCTPCGPVPCLENVVCPCTWEVPTCPSGMPVCVNQCTPIVLDPFDEGFHLTSVGAGVKFRVNVNGPLVQMSWTDQSWRNGWLALDRNGNGMVDDFTELFGNMTPQPEGKNPNGFLALAIFDDPANGGNDNAAIDPGDSVYSRLRAWIDTNHNGISEASELHTLQELGIFKIGLKYHKTPFTDQYGNEFRYRAKAWSDGEHGHDICYDVVLQMATLVKGAK